MYLVMNTCVTAVKVSNFSGHYLRNCSTLDIGVFGYISILYHKEQPPEVWHIPPGTPCIYIYIYIIIRYIKMDVFVCMFQHNSGMPGAISTKIGTHD
jgi:hypothetical protein